MHVQMHLQSTTLLYYFSKTSKLTHSHVVPNRVGQDDHTALSCLQFPGRLHSCSHGGPAGPPTEKPLLTDQLSGVAECLLVLALEPAVHHRAVKHGGDEVVANTFNLCVRMWLEGLGLGLGLGRARVRVK